VALVETLLLQLQVDLGSPVELRALEPPVALVVTPLLRFQVDLGLIFGLQVLVKLHTWSSHKYFLPFEFSSQNFPQTCLGPNVLAFQTSSSWRLYDDAYAVNENPFLFQSFDSSNDKSVNCNSQRYLCSFLCDDDGAVRRKSNAQKIFGAKVAAHWKSNDRKSDAQKIFDAKVAVHLRSGDFLRGDGAFEACGDHNCASDLSNDASSHAYATAIFSHGVNAASALFPYAHDVYDAMAD